MQHGAVAAPDRRGSALAWYKVVCALPTLFGSRAYGLGSPTSDVDLCIVAPQDIVVGHGDDLRARS